jgi:hypothetical protein
MRKFMIIFGVIVLIALLGAAIYGLYIAGGADQSALERIRDIAIVMIGVLIILSTLLLVLLVAVSLYVALTIKDKIIPIMESLLDTANRVKGTTEFLTEEVASPVISAYGTVAKARAMTRIVTGRDRGNERRTITRLLKR